MSLRQSLHTLFRGLRKLALLFLGLLLVVAALALVGITPAFLGSLTSNFKIWLTLGVVLTALFWGLAYLLDPFRSGPASVDALYAQARSKLRWHRRLGRAERLCYDAMSLYTPVSEQGLTESIASLGPDRFRALLYTLREIYLDKAHDTLSKALATYELNPAAFAAHSPAFEATLRDAGFAQLPGRLATRLEELIRR